MQTPAVMLNQVPQQRFSLAFDTGTLLTGTVATRRLLASFTAIQNGRGDDPQDLRTFNLWCALQIHSGIALQSCKAFQLQAYHCWPMSHSTWRVATARLIACCSTLPSLLPDCNAAAAAGLNA